MERYLEKNKLALKRVLFKRLSAKPSLRFKDRMFFGFAGLALAAFALVVVGSASKNNVALAGVNPFATPEAKGRNLLSSAAKQAELGLKEDLPKDQVQERQALVEELRAASKAPEVEWLEDGTLNAGSSEDETRQNQKFVVADQVVESLGQAMQLRPQEVKKQVRYRSEQGETVFLGFGRDGELIFRASSVEPENIEQDSGGREGEVKGEFQEQSRVGQERDSSKTETEPNEASKEDGDSPEEVKEWERRGGRMK